MLKVLDKITGALMHQTSSIITASNYEDILRRWPKKDHDYVWEDATSLWEDPGVPGCVEVDETIDLPEDERNRRIEENIGGEALPEITPEILATKLPVVEIFDSIQGEGCLIGMPATFIRLAGCDAGCPWCDSKKTWKKPNIDDDFHSLVQSYIQDAEVSGTELDVRFLDGLDHSDLTGPWAIDVIGHQWLLPEEIAKACNKGIVVITGGEPCIHENLGALVQIIKGQHPDALVCIETNGAQATPIGIDWVVCSPKSVLGYKIHPDCQWDELKYVVDDNFTPEIVPPEVLNGEVPNGVCWLQPCDTRYGMSAAEKKQLGEINILEATEVSWNACYKLAMEYKCFRVGIQLHKFMDVE